MQGQGEFCDRVVDYDLLKIDVPDGQDGYICSWACLAGYAARRALLQHLQLEKTLAERKVEAPGEPVRRYGFL
jgi:hypothetical protein